MNRNELINFILSTLTELAERENLQPNRRPAMDTVIFGQNGLLDSMLLVELMLALEDFCAANNMEFTWASDSAMSEKRSVYHDAESLADFIIENNKIQK